MIRWNLLKRGWFKQGLFRWGVERLRLYWQSRFPVVVFMELFCPCIFIYVLAGITSAILNSPASG